MTNFDFLKDDRFKFFIEEQSGEDAAIDYNDLFIARIKEIYLCLHNQLFLSALTMALTLPDICGKVEFKNAKTNKDRYTKWCEKHLPLCHPAEISQKGKSKLPYLNGEALYALRCSVLHEGKPDYERKKVQSSQSKPTEFFLFYGDELSQLSSREYDYETGETGKSVLEINISCLSEEIIQQATMFYKEHEGKFEKYRITSSLEDFNYYL